MKKSLEIIDIKGCKLKNRDLTLNHCVHSMLVKDRFIKDFI